MTEDHITAFLFAVLYGYWLGDGWLEGGNARIAFGPIKPQDWDALDAVLARLPLPKLQNIKRGALGYWRATNLTKGGQRNYYICAEAWWSTFSASSMATSTLASTQPRRLVPEPCDVASAYQSAVTCRLFQLAMFRLLQ